MDRFLDALTSFRRTAIGLVEIIVLVLISAALVVGCIMAAASRIPRP